MTCRHFGLTSNRSVPSTQRAPTGPQGQNTRPNNIIQLPAGARSARRPTSGLTTRDFLSVPGAPYVVRRPWLQMAIDILAVLSAAFFVFVTGVGVAAAFFILMFVRT